MSPPKTHAAKRLPPTAPDNPLLTTLPSQPKPEDPAMPLPTPASSRQAESTSPSPVQGHGWQRRELVIWGAHGGAGTTTLALWLQPAWDMGAMRTEPDPPSCSRSFKMRM